MELFYISKYNLLDSRGLGNSFQKEFSGRIFS